MTYDKYDLTTKPQAAAAGLPAGTFLVTAQCEIDLDPVDWSGEYETNVAFSMITETGYTTSWAVLADGDMLRLGYDSEPDVPVYRGLITIPLDLPSELVEMRLRQFALELHEAFINMPTRNKVRPSVQRRRHGIFTRGPFPRRS